MPTRSCIACRNKKEKKDLLRIICDDDFKATIDKLQKISKRAVYLCKDEQCINKVLKIIEKGKLKLKIGINLDSLKILLNDIKNELGE